MNLSKDKNITITKKNTGITFNTAQTFVDKDISLNLTVQDAVADQSCSVDVVPSVALDESKNIFFSDIDNGVSLVVGGGAIATAAAEFTVSTPGFISEGRSTETPPKGEIKYTQRFVSGVSVPKPSEGVNSFFIKFDQTLYKFSIDSDGNVTVE